MNGSLNEIHPSAVVAQDVRMGRGNVIGPNAVLFGPLTLGDENWIGPGVVLGTPPEVRGVEHTAQWARPSDGPGVRIGSRNVIREYATVHAGWQDDTVIGDDCFIMNKVYVAHDCRVHDGATLASSVTLGGHVVIGARANLGMSAVVHQRRLVGPGAMVGMGAVVTRDVPPWAKAYGNPARVRGGNVVGMERVGTAAEDAATIDRSYRDAERALPPAPADVPDALAESFDWWRSVAHER
ncbi:acyl-ACP--UDP-N- acetylglucosamine O-acyltransferase [Actinotalea ferrariae CF5-4]|uniref:Acyl-ACP--UDP-N-acetylglucosamine O-acyltransferase n=1 Tax=Actinotalea ferrariae CF5-4 TaxID=948458 RepID=A0A021VUE4_9CELL|nr:hypothetical protein [Actinotalea ferrariae]EYR64771.1 acyl-ACP--UDP-N- acetylglucosamine O-acyltransferase [Actinotalea ferrariae CF5-4]